MQQESIGNAIRNASTTASPEVGLQAAYLELLKKCLTFALWEARDGSMIGRSARWKARIKQMLGLVSQDPSASRIQQELRNDGLDWPVLAHTMIGMKRLNNLQFCVEEVLRRGVPGDLIETGVWRGGATILMRGILKAYGVKDRCVWVADSFEGLPPPDTEKYPADSKDIHHTFKPLAVSAEEVRANFEAYGLLDDQVCFLKGWFKDTLPAAPIQQLAVVRLDGDMYESTMDGLTHLYPKLSAGGYLIVDDYGALAGCRTAVEDYRQTHRITEPIQSIGSGGGAFWQKVR